MKEIHIPTNDINNSLKSSIARLCPNLKWLSTVFMQEEIESLKVILNNCQQLESMEVEGGEDHHLNECKLLEIVTKYSPKKFFQLKITWSYI